MNDLMNQLLDQFEAGLMDRTLKVMNVITDEKKRYPMELNKSQCSEMLLGTRDTGTFDDRFNSHKDFPRIEGKREKYPRDAVIEWYHKNWQRTAIQENGMNLLTKLKNRLSKEINTDWKVVAMDLNRDNDGLRNQMKALIQENVDLRRILQMYKEKENV